MRGGVPGLLGGRAEDDVTTEYLLELLDSDCRAAAEFAIPQCIAHTTYQRFKSTTTDGSQGQGSRHYSQPLRDVCPWLTPPEIIRSEIDPGYPHYLWDIPVDRGFA